MRCSLAWLEATVLARHAAAPRPPRAATAPSRRRLHGDHGEGVISAAIAVLIVAFLGAAMWLGFQRMWQRTEERTNTQVEQIGGD